MASNNNLSATTTRKYSSNANLKQTVSFPNYKQDSEELKAKNWNLNQMRMNQSLNEFMKTINKSPLNMSKNTNLDITNLDEDDSVVYHSRVFNESATNTNQMNEDESRISTTNNTLNSNSSTAEFKKYLDDLKKNYLEKLTFSCPSKVSYRPNSNNAIESNYSTTANSNPNNVSYKLKSVENINNLLSSKTTPLTSLVNQNPTRRSLFFDTISSRINEETLNDSNEMNKLAPSDDIFQTPDLTKTQILSRLVQIREYLKQSYAMLSTLETSNDLMNYSSQMNKLHSLIDHLKEQEKAYLDLLNSFSKYQQLASSLTYSAEANTNERQVQKDILDLTDLNESVQNQYKLQQEEQTHLFNRDRDHQNCLSSSKSVAVQTNLNDTITTAANNLNANTSVLSNRTNNTAKRDENNLNEESIANSLSGSFISDTLTLNGVNCDGLYKYKHKTNVKLTEHDKTNDNTSDLIVIGKGYNLNSIQANKQITDDDENKTENDLDLLEYEDEETNDGGDNQDEEVDYSNVREQRKEIMSALDNDLITLEQLKEQKRLLKSIRLRKEELKALEGRRKALEALRQIAMDNETQIDHVITKSKQDDETLINKSFSNKSNLVRKTFKHSESFDQNEDDDIEDYISQKSETKSKQIIQKYEDLKKTSPNNESLLKTVTVCYNQNEEDDDEDQVEDTNQEKEILNRELNQKMVDLAENEKKLEELYSMQSRLAQLKDIIVDFNGIKSSNDETNNETAQKYFSLLDKVEKEQEEEQQQSKLISNYRDETELDLDDIDERDLNASNREQLREHKAKLASAKEKLKQLQDLIGKLKAVSSTSLSSASKCDLTPTQQHKLEQKEAAAALELLNEIERQKQQDRLDELKRNKQKLLELLKQKENESAELARLYSLHSNQKLDQPVVLSPNKTTNDYIYPVNEIKNDFETAENDLDQILNSKVEQLHSPSDVLWTQMQKQLSMRENLRNKKKELEDLIRDENKLDNVESNRVNQNDEEDEENSNKIINGYKDFFLKNKTNCLNNISKYSKMNEDDVEDEDEEKEDFKQKTQVLDELNDDDDDDEEEDDEETIMKRYMPSNRSSRSLVEKKSTIQQENICSTDELIKENDYDKFYEEEEDEEEKYELNKNLGSLFSKYNDSSKKEQENEQTCILNSLNTKFNDLLLNQQQLNESIQRNFNQLLSNEENTNTNKPLNNQYLMASQFQFQTQMQVQQLMFNLNAAYHEIATQRSEMAQLNEQMKTINSKLADLTKPKLTNSIGINTFEEQTNDSKQRSSSLITTTNALPGYFYNRRQNSFTNSRLNSNDSSEKVEYQAKRLNYLRQTSNSLYNYENYIDNKPNRHEVYYTDDFEDCEEEDEEKSKKEQEKEERSRRSSNASSTKTNRSVDTTTTATNVSDKSSSLSSNHQPYWIEQDSKKLNNNEQIVYKNQTNSKTECSSMSTQQPSQISYDGELFSFDRMREKIYSEVATLISQNEARPFFLLNLFRELQYLKDKNARDQTLKCIFNINNRNETNETSLRSHLRSSVLESVSNDLSLRAKNKARINQEDDDDLISYKYRLKKSEQIHKETDLKQQENDNESSRTQSPFASDSLSNTVIFVRNSPNCKQPLKVKYPPMVQKKPEEIVEFSRSSSSSIMGLQTETSKSNQAALDEFLSNQSRIESEVKNFISKIIKSIKSSDDNEYEDDDEDDDEIEDEDDEYISLDEEILNNSKSSKQKSNIKSNSYKYARCDSDYLNEIIDKVLNVLKQSNEHYDYLRLYQNQLSSYLKEALNKYENKRLIKCMEDILIDISDILYNELTFYSIMNNSSICSMEKNKQQQSRLNSTNIDTQTSRSDNFNLNLIKSLRKNTNKLNEKKNLIKEPSNEDDECESSQASFQVKQINFNHIPSSTNMSRSTSTCSETRSTSSQRTNHTSRTNSVDTAANDEEAIYYFDENSVKTKLDCFKTNDLNSKLESNYAEILTRLKYILNEKSSDLNSLLNTSNEDLQVEIKTSNCLNEIKLECDSTQKSLNENETNNEIKIEDLPVKLDVPKTLCSEKNEPKEENKESSSPKAAKSMSDLEQLVMNSISDDLVGDANEMPMLPNPHHDKSSEDENDSQHSHSKSETSDNFVVISETSNISSDDSQGSQVLVDDMNKIKQDDDEIKPDDQTLVKSENTTITDLNETS